MAKQTFTTGQVLTAAQMTSLQQTAMGGGAATAKTASYVLTAADAGTVVQMNAAGATTITVNTALFAAGDSVQIQNIGAGVCTVTAGTATVTTAGSLALSQWEGGNLYFTSTSASIFFDIVQSSGMTNPMTTTGDTIYSSSGSTPARLGIGSTGQVLTVAAGIPSWATPAAGAVTLIGTTTLSSAAADITFSSISGSYQNLTMICQLRSTSASNQANLQIQLNGDTGSNYWTVGGSRYAASGSAVNLFDNTGTYINAQYIISGGAQAAKYSSPVTITIPNYKGTTLAKTLQFAGADYSDGPQFCAGTGGWNSTAAITSIKIYPDANNFKAGCSISLYGWS